MSRDHLVCARCAAPVAEGRCPVCRASRRELPFRLSAPLLALIAALLAAVAVLALATQRYALA